MELRVRPVNLVFPLVFAGGKFCNAQATEAAFSARNPRGGLGHRRVHALGWCKKSAFCVNGVVGTVTGQVWPGVSSNPQPKMVV